MFACVGISSETVFRGENGYYIELVFQQNVHSLLFLGGIVFRVLRKVTVTTGNLDLFSNLGTLRCV